MYIEACETRSRFLQHALSCYVCCRSLFLYFYSVVNSDWLWPPMSNSRPAGHMAPVDVQSPRLRHYLDKLKEGMILTDWDGCLKSGRSIWPALILPSSGNRFETNNGVIVPRGVQCLSTFEAFEACPTLKWLPWEVFQWNGLSERIGNPQP